MPVATVDWFRFRSRCEPTAMSSHSRPSRPSQKIPRPTSTRRASFPTPATPRLLPQRTNLPSIPRPPRPRSRGHRGRHADGKTPSSARSCGAAPLVSRRRQLRVGAESLGARQLRPRHFAALLTAAARGYGVRTRLAAWLVVAVQPTWLTLCAPLSAGATAPRRLAGGVLGCTAASRGGILATAGQT